MSKQSTNDGLKGQQAISPGQRPGNSGQRPGYQETQPRYAPKGQKQTDELHAELHRVYRQIEALPKLFPMDEQQVMDEVDRQLAHLIHDSESGASPDMDRFVREVYADMGLKDSAVVVFSLTYAVVAIVNQPALDIDPTVRERLHQLNQESRCGRIVDNFITGIQRSGKSFTYRFNPPADAPSPRHKAGKAYYDETNSDNMLLSEDILNYGINQEKPRTFTLDAIVDYAQRNLSLDASQTIQNMLYRLLSEDGTEEERAKVDSIPVAIMKRSAQPNIVGQMVGTQTVLGNAEDLKNLLQSDEVRKLLQQP